MSDTNGMSEIKEIPFKIEDLIGVNFRDYKFRISDDRFNRDKNGFGFIKVAWNSPGYEVAQFGKVALWLDDGTTRRVQDIEVIFARIAYLPPRS